MASDGFFPDLDALDAATVEETPADDTSAPDASGTATTTIQTVAQAAPPVTSQPSIYIDSNDVMVFSVWNSNSALTTLSLILRVITPDGQVNTMALNLPALTSDRMINTVTMALQEGSLVSAMVSGLRVPVSRGQCFASATMQRGGQTNPPAVFNLFSDYVTTGNSPQWPNGRNLSGLDGPGFMTTVQIPPPGAGNEVNFVVPPGVRWRVISWANQFQTSGVAGNRTPTFFLSTEVPAVVFILTSQITVTGTETIDYFLSSGLPVYSAFVGIQLMPIPIDLHVQSGYNFFTQTVGMLAGDKYNYSNLIVEEWLDV